MICKIEQSKMYFGLETPKMFILFQFQIILRPYIGLILWDFELLRIFCNYLTCVLWDDLRCAIAPKNLSFMTQQASFFSPVWYEVVKSDWRITVYACRDGKSANKIGEFNITIINQNSSYFNQLRHWVLGCRPLLYTVRAPL